MLNLDAVEMNIYLGKSLKNNIQKLQMLSKEFKSIFTGLQRKTNMINQSANSVIQPFWSEPYPTTSKDVGGRGFLFARRRNKQLSSKSVSSADSENTQSTKVSLHTSNNKKWLYAEKIQNFQPARSLQYFLKKLGKANKPS